MARAPRGSAEVTLLSLIADRGLPELLQLIAGLMENRGSITSVILRECAGIEAWAEGREP